MCYIQAFINKLNLWRQHFDFSLTIFLSLGKKKKKWCSEIKFYQRHRPRIINDIFLKYWVDVGVPGGENPTRHTHRSHTHGCDLAILTHSNLKIRNLRVQKKEKVSPCRSRSFKTLGNIKKKNWKCHLKGNCPSFVCTISYTAYTQNSEF